MKYNLIIIFSFILPILFSSCSNTANKVLECNGNCPIILEGRQWHGLFDRHGGFELKFTNQSEKEIDSCYLILDHKYKHTWEGLYSQDRGLLKNSIIYPHEVCTIQFSDIITNQDYFNIKESGYIPYEITLECKGCSSTWKF